MPIGNTCLFIAILLQTADPKPQRFEVASVKASGPGKQHDGINAELMRRVLRPGSINMPDPGRVRIERQPMLDLLAAAYSLRAEQVTAPAWAADTAFDIEAVIPPKTESDPPNRVNLMLQALLKDRFGLVARLETRVSAGYALVVGKGGPKLQEAAAQKQMTKKEVMQEQSRRMTEIQKSPKTPGSSFSRYSSTTLADFTMRLSGIVGSPVTDMTGLPGKYDISLEISKDTPDEPGITIFQAVEKLGLKLEPRKIPLQFLIVETLTKLPIEN
jgi:uncharacterized protein (TIGR03435 family)